MATTKSKERTSLCEESMLVIVNILKFSSLSLARIATSSSAGDSVPPPSKRSLAKSSSVAGKAQKAPERGSKLSYVMLPTANGEDYYSIPSGPTSTVVVHRGNGRRGSSKKMDGCDGKFADYIKRFHEKKENEVQNAIVECKVSDYIKRFHEKNRKDSNNESKRLPYAVLPPHLHLSPPN